MNARWVAIGLVAAGVVATWVLRELVVGIITDGVSLNPFGVTVLALWGALVVVGVVAITRARDADPDFRGAFSELLRVASLGLLLLVFAVLVVMNGTRPFEWESLNAQGHCVNLGNVTRCRIP